MSKEECRPIRKTLSWPIRYIKKHISGGPSEFVELKVLFSNDSVQLIDYVGKFSFDIESYVGYVVIGSGRYGGENTECISYRAVGPLSTVNLFMVIPSSGVQFTNLGKIKIIFPGPIKLDDTIITPQSLTMFQQFSFNFLSRRIHNALKPIS